MSTPSDSGTALLAWGRHDTAGGWWAGVAFLHQERRATTLITMWVPAGQVQRRRGQLYLDVPRILLSGP